MPAHAPIQDPILSFSHTFSLKSAQVGGQNPPKMGPRPPTENPGSGPEIHGGKNFKSVFLRERLQMKLTSDGHIGKERELKCEF